MQAHRKRKPGPSKKHAVPFESATVVHTRYPTLPLFTFEECFDYGRYADSPPEHRHFVPRYSKLKKAGGKSITFYEKWRRMQYDMNCVMKKFMNKAQVNLSVLPPCANYNLWRRPSWRKAYNKPLDEDPCPDCDVRFRWEKNVWKTKVAPASILSESRWPRNQFKDSVIMIGLPQHIAIGFLRFVGEDQAVFEFFDPAGPTGDREGVRELRKWVEQDLPRRIGKPVEFHQCHRKVNFQHDIDDVMCQTWIWYWVYFRVIHEMSPKTIATHVRTLIDENRSLKHVHRFNCWLSDLYNIGFRNKETVSQTNIAQSDTPRDPRTERTNIRDVPSTSLGSPRRSRNESSLIRLSRQRPSHTSRGSVSNRSYFTSAQTGSVSTVNRQSPRRVERTNSNVGPGTSRNVYRPPQARRARSDAQRARAISPQPNEPTLIRKEIQRGRP